MNEMTMLRTTAADTRLLRLGFLGVGWIGRHRMMAMLDTGLAQAVAIADPSADMAAEALKLAPGAALATDLDALLEYDLDGVVIATPSADHAAQAIQALDRGVAVFCQKPLGRSRAEVAAVVEAARQSGRLLGVDLSYRHTQGMRQIRDLIRGGELGHVFAADLVFHNAYGPDKPWFYDKSLSGGGCVMDLGVHLADLALWALDFPEVARVEGRLFAGGEPLPPESNRVEDFADAAITLEDGTAIRLTCSWRLQAGCDALIEARFYGTQGGAALRNVDGSFYDFVSERYAGTQSTTLSAPPEDWGGRAAAAWIKQLSGKASFDPECERLIQVAEVLDAIYQS